MSFGYRRHKNDQGKPKILSGRDIPSLAKYIKSKDCENVFLMLGAGVSTSAGIPDFRSPETGLYSNLARLNLPHPEAVFEISFFRKNPVPFYTLAHELYPGKFRPTPTHSFIRLLSEKSLLHTCFTQNIDTLERRAGVPDDKIIEAHGSFASQRCIKCQEPFDDDKMKQHILDKKIAKCEKCGGYVKPDIVFFGEGLPPNFIRSVPNLRKADLLIVMGTSLTVQPFASLAGMVESRCPRVLINLDHVGDFGARADDVILLGKCDDVIKDLCEELGWEEELTRLWNETEATVLTDGQPKAQESSPGERQEEQKKPDVLKDLEEKLAELAVEDQGDVPAKPAEVRIGNDKGKVKPDSVPKSQSQSQTPSKATTSNADQTDGQTPLEPSPSSKSKDTVAEQQPDIAPQPTEGKL